LPTKIPFDVRIEKIELTENDVGTAPEIDAEERLQLLYRSWIVALVVVFGLIAVAVNGHMCMSSDEEVSMADANRKIGSGLKDPNAVLMEGDKVGPSFKNFAETMQRTFPGNSNFCLWKFHSNSR